MKFLSSNRPQANICLHKNIYLAWLIPEIRCIFEKISIDLKELLEETAPRQPLVTRALNAFLQIQGIFSILEINGVTELVQAMVNMLKKMDLDSCDVDAHNVDAILEAQHAVFEYLNDLQGGLAEEPLFLYPYFEVLKQCLRDKNVHPGELYFPANLENHLLPQSASHPLMPDDYGRLRQQFEIFLLVVLKNESTLLAKQSFQGMFDIISEIANRQVLGEDYTFWFIVAGLMETLFVGEIALTLPIKNFLGRVNLQIRRLMRGDNKLEDRIKREALFFMINAMYIPPGAQSIIDHFQIKKPSLTSYTQLRYRQYKNEVLLKASECLEDTKQLWERIVCGEEGLEYSLKVQIKSLTELSYQLNVPALSSFLSELTVGAHYISALTANTTLGIEFATYLLFIESTFAEISSLPENFEHRVDELANRFVTLIAGGVVKESEKTCDFFYQGEYRQILSAVCEGIKQNLRVVENALDAYYLNPDDRLRLEPVNDSLHQIEGAFAMLEHRGAQMGIAHISLSVKLLSKDHPLLTEEENINELLSVAQSLGVLGFFTECLANDPIFALKHYGFDQDLGRFIEYPEGHDFEEETHPVLNFSQTNFVSKASPEGALQGLDPDSCFGMPNNFAWGESINVCLHQDLYPHDDFFQKISCSVVPVQEVFEESVAGDGQGLELNQISLEDVVLPDEQLLGRIGSAEFSDVRDKEGFSELSLLANSSVNLDHSNDDMLLSYVEQNSLHQLVKPLSRLSAQEQEIQDIKFEQVPPSPVNAIWDEFDGELLQIFLGEAKELVPKIGQMLWEWRDSRVGNSHMHPVLHMLHTLKGSARMAGAMRLGKLLHELESRVAQILRSSVKTDPDFDEITAIYERGVCLLDEINSSDLLRGTGLNIAQPPNVAITVSAIPHEGEEIFRNIISQIPTVRIRADILDQLSTKVEEIDFAHAAQAIQMDPLVEAMNVIFEGVNQLNCQLRELKVPHLQCNALIRQATCAMGESIDAFLSIRNDLDGWLSKAKFNLRKQDDLTKNLQQTLRQVRMVPFSRITERLYGVVRKTCKELEKRVNLDIQGGEIELNSAVLEKITGSVEHLLRNAIVHGIESLQERQFLGKSDVGELCIELFCENNEILILVRDDGRGVDFNKIAKRAREMGLIGEIMPTDVELAQLIFTPGFSTAHKLTELAGRGVGMGVVRAEVAALGGRVTLTSQAKRGACFMVHLPIKQAVIQVLLIKAGGAIYAIPSILLEQIQQFKVAQLQLAIKEGSIWWQKKRIPIHFLPNLLEGNQSLPNIQENTHVLILQSNQQQQAILVDAIEGHLEVVIKNVEPQIRSWHGVLGETVLLSGQTIPVLNPVMLSV